MTGRRPAVIAIAAVDDEGGLARGGQLPWHAPSDLKRFSRLTTGRGQNAVVMGRLTWDSLEPRYRPLPRRRNLVLTRGPFSAEGAETVHTLEDAVAASGEADALWVCGGAQVYALGFELGLVDAVELTRISGCYGCDLFFPPIPRDFRRVSAETRRDGDLTIVDERWERVAR